MKRAGLALGSNLGDRLGAIREARNLVAALASASGPLLQSRIYATSPVECPEGSGEYLNAVMEIGWNGSAKELLHQTQDIERRLGRTRSGITGEPRTIDIDLLYLDEEQWDSPGLTLPHPRLHLRKFVLVPLNDIRPDLIIPACGISVTALLGKLGNDEPPPVLTEVKW